MNRIMGLETEYGVAAGSRGEDQISAASLFLGACRLDLCPQAIWDYGHEMPWQDLRGFSVEEQHDVPSPAENRLGNKFLPTGGRLYIDAGHPEYSTPECLGPRQLVAYEKAGDRLMALTLAWANEDQQAAGPIRIYKNNSDRKGNSYGSHENYLVPRHVPLEAIIEAMVPFLVTRQIFTGAGKVGSENGAEAADFQMSQRTDFLETLLGLATMNQRPIFNTRDEPHANPAKWRRLHVIAGDSNMCEIASYLKYGTTSVLLDLVEHGTAPRHLALRDPLSAARLISRDLSCRRELTMDDGRKMTAVQIQWEYLNAAWDHYSRSGLSLEIKSLLARWGSVLERLEEDPMLLSRELDWPMKKATIESHMQQWRCSWKDSRVAMLDLQFHDIRPEKGVYFLLEKRGFAERLLSDDEIEVAMASPPSDTRAFFRTWCLQNLADEIYGASWSSVMFKHEQDRAIRLPLMEPGRGTQSLVGPILEKCKSAREVLKNLTAGGKGG